MLVTCDPVDIEIENAIFKVKPLTGTQALRILGNGGLEKLQQLDPEVLINFLKACVVSAIIDGVVYDPSVIEMLDMPTLIELTGKVMELNSFRKK
jgi:hypothetical protein